MTARPALALLFALMISLGSTGCGSRSSRHASPPPVIAAFLTVENNDPDDIEVYLDFELVGIVPGYSTTTFATFPGDYELSIDVIGDGEGPTLFTNVRLRQQAETYVEFSVTLFDVFIDIVFE